jgi:HAD superfamily hydrolase (TIGR01509 family)
LPAALGNEVRAIDGIPELIGRIRLPFCVASNSTHHRVRVSLEAAGLLPLFEGNMFSSEDVANPKPAPDLFLHAARAMGASPPRCIVIEDTTTGVRAAVAAGMQVFGYAGGAHSDPAALRAEGATVFNDMQSLAALLAA